MSSEMTSNVASNAAIIAARIKEAVGVVLSLRSEANQLSSQITDWKKKEHETRERIAAIKLEEEQISKRISETNTGSFQTVRDQSAGKRELDPGGAELVTGGPDGSDPPSIRPAVPAGAGGGKPGGAEEGRRTVETNSTSPSSSSS
eukprot:GHVU01188269.1.p3 GENE.GHVU01188269.1~~GHVU01188269.1.p3  ORF type:complete len:146 (+),score=17.96 GHVU01188269.1:1239-1676(+)